MLKTGLLIVVVVIILALTSFILLAGIGDPPVKDLHLVLIGEMDEFAELDTWTPVTEGNAPEETAAAEQALQDHYPDLMDLVRLKSVVALSRYAPEQMAAYQRVPELTDVKLVPVAESADGKLLLLAGVWAELPRAAPSTPRRLMIYPIYERDEKKVSRMTVTIRVAKP